MNNTKWREVFKLLARYNIYFKIRWINSPWIDPSNGSLSEVSYNSYPLMLNYIAEDHIQDGGFNGGPFYYEEIEFLQVQKILRQDEYYFTKYQDIANDFFTLVSELKKIGQLPLEINNAYLVINAYKSL
ncbi:MAG: hypothetical protein WAX77_04705 [Methylococcaceae bacterium]